MKNIASGEAVKLPYKIQELTGTVMSETTRSETNVTGYIPNRNSSWGGRISSKTTHQQTIYIMDDEGHEHAPEIINMPLSCREGHRITLWGINGGCWFEGYNHNTKQFFGNEANLFDFAKSTPTLDRIIRILTGLVFAYYVAQVFIKDDPSLLILGCIVTFVSYLAIKIVMTITIGVPILNRRMKIIKAQKEKNMVAVR